MKQYAKLSMLQTDASSVSDSAVSTSVAKLAGLLKKSRQIGRLQINVSGKRKVSHYCLELLAGDCKVSKAAVEDPDFEVGVASKTFAEIAAGELSPVDAFYSGRMEVAGSLAFGKRIYALAAAKKGTTDIEP